MNLGRGVCGIGGGGGVGSCGGGVGVLKDVIRMARECKMGGVYALNKAIDE